MRTSLLAGMTTRGTSFLTAGAATVLAGLLLGERGLLCVGVALLALPLLARLAAGRAPVPAELQPDHQPAARARRATPPP